MPGNNTNDPRLELHHLQAVGEIRQIRRQVEHRELRLDPIGEQIEDSPWSLSP